MAITYTWKVTGLNTKTVAGVTGAVVQTRWTKTGTDEDGNTGTFYGATPFSVTDTTNFVPYEELTEEIVLSWIKVEAAKYEDHIDGQILKQINNMKTPIDENKSLPWSNE